MITEHTNGRRLKFDWSYFELLTELLMRIDLVQRHCRQSMSTFFSTIVLRRLFAHHLFDDELEHIP